jgi:hypothetical protein
LPGGTDDREVAVEGGDVVVACAFGEDGGVDRAEG